MNCRWLLLPTLFLLFAIGIMPARAQYQYPFQDPNLPKELRGFKRVPLQAGELKTIELSLLANSLARWDMSRHTFVLNTEKLSCVWALPLRIFV